MLRMDTSEKNLYEFYHQIATGKHVRLIECEAYYAIHGNHGNWPQIVFDIRFEGNPGTHLNKVFSDLADIGDVNLAVCNRQLFTANDQELLRHNQIFPVGSWQLMELESPDVLKTDVPADYEMQLLATAAEVDAFTALVNTDMMKGQVVNKELFQELSNFQSICMYGLFKGKELVSGLLSFTGSNKVAGLYFITTKLDFRGKGLAGVLIKNAAKLLFNNGAGKVVLQALPKAVPLYFRLGFSQKGELVIFWKQQHGKNSNIR